MPWTDTKAEAMRSSVVLVYDDFDRADTTEPNIGVAPRGGPWKLLGQFGSPPASRGKISSKYVVSSVVGNVGGFYFKTAEIQAAIVEIEVTAKWVTAGGTGSEPFIGSGLFKTGAPYPAYDAIYSRWYRNIISLDKFTGGNMTNVQLVTLSPALGVNTDHVLLWRLWPELSRIQLSINGTVKIDVTHSSLKDYMFRNPFFQLNYANADSTHEARFKKVVVKGAYGWVNDIPQSKEL